ncbi:MAG: hypothetical protein ACI920_001921 [Saprospiraceae bacterium]
MQQPLNTYLLNLIFEKRENPKIFELQKTQCASPKARRVKFLRGKNGFYKTVFAPQTSFF